MKNKLIISVLVALLLILLYNKGFWLGCQLLIERDNFSIHSNLNDSVKVLVRVDGGLTRSIEHIDKDNDKLIKTNVYYHSNGIIEKIITTQNNNNYFVYKYRHDGSLSQTEMYKYVKSECKSKAFKDCLIAHGEENKFDSLGNLEMVIVWDMGVLLNTFNNKVYDKK